MLMALLQAKHGAHRAHRWRRVALAGGALLLASLVLLLHRRHAAAPPRKLSTGGGACQAPHLNLSAPTLAQECLVLNDTCFDQGSIILYGHEYSPAAPPTGTSRC